jgi:hypothetical protein
MPTVATLPGNIRIEQRYKEHHPPHFHAMQAGNEVSLQIAPAMGILRGGLPANALADVRQWASTRRHWLALNWVDALAQATIQGIP